MEGREKALWLAGAGVALLSLVVVVVLAAGSGGGDDESLRSFDGVLTVVEDDRLRLLLDEPADGRNEIELVVRPEDRAALDIQHLELHAAQALGTRIFYERDGEEYIAREALDLP
jgi:hypothetical protein